MIKLFDLLIGTLRKINPQERVLLIVLMIGILFLTEVARSVIDDNKQEISNQIIELKVREGWEQIKIDSLSSNIVLWRHRYDSLYFKGITDKQETIDKLKLISQYLKKLNKK